MSDETGISHIHCVGHVINLIIQRVLKDKTSDFGEECGDTENIGLNESELNALSKFQALRKKLKNIVVEFHTSTDLTNTLVEHQIRK